MNERSVVEWKGLMRRESREEGIGLTSDTSTSPDNLRAEVSLESGRRPEMVPVQDNYHTHTHT